MKNRKSGNSSLFFMEDRFARHFFKFFKSKPKVTLRPGAMPPEEVKKLIQQIGKHKKVNIRRVEFDGTPEEHPVTVQIVDIRDEYFTGKVVNVERSIKQDLDDKLVYVKGGGGTIDFYYTDGDIMSIEEDIDEIVIQQMNEKELLEILDALDLDESILISYYDMDKGGVINGTGKLIEKDVENRTFKVELSLINDIELDEPKTIEFNLENDKVLDLEVVI
ncbi:MAG TPA: hypothetical protein ENK44_17180 [Caldithrix abyssi]|uniref:Uncharacterized protein n=1 Tax=Caldithrix abyssi TaxID=187145 RepID=A0A7V4U5V6_CALAY|nr:hypothetical protein [Caldithrix abyssi]